MTRARQYSVDPSAPLRRMRRRRAAGGTLAATLAVVLAASIAPSPASAHGGELAIEYSASPTRASATAMDGATISGRAYAYLPTDGSMTSVEFRLDDTDLAGPARRVDRAAPFDFAGGSAASALPLDTLELGDGSHTISARVTHADSDITVVESTFTVANGTARRTTDAAAAASAAGATTTTTTRVNAGGPAVTTGSGSWGADAYFSGGKTYTNKSVTAIAGTTDDAVYLTERSATTTLGGFGYAIPAPASGSYTVTLHFAEIYFGATGGGAGGAGKRVFSANLEGGATELVDFDIFAAVGAMTAVTRTYTVPVTDGTLDLAFTAKVNQPKVSAITVVAPSGATETDPPATDWSTFSWSDRATAPIPRAESQGTVVDGRLYVFSGFDTAWNGTKRADVYDIASNTWSRLPDVPVFISHSPAVADGTTIWLVGGYGGPGTTRTWKFDTVTRTYTAGPELPSPRGAGAAAIVGRELHFFGGGRYNTDVDKPDHWALNLDGGTAWESRAPLPNPRNHVGGVALDGKIYAIGGQYKRDEDAGLQSTVNRYDPATDAWTTMASLPKPRSHIATVALNGRILVIGGTNPGATSSRDVTAYDPATNTWSALASLPGGRKTGVAGVVGNSVYFTGGGFSTATYVGRAR